MIRNADDGDITRLMEIRLTVRENALANPNKVTPDDYRWFVRNPGIFVWEEDGGIHGFAAADTRNGNIWALFVDQAYCGRGVGRALLSSVCSVLRTAGFEKAWLITDPNTRAERFYRRAGWQHVGEQDNELLFEFPL